VYDQDHQHTDDDSDFWDRIPDGRLDGLRSALRERASGLSARLPKPALPKPAVPRLAGRTVRPERGSSRTEAHPAARRQHTDSIPVVRSDGHESSADRRPVIDPLLRRTGVLAIVITLLVPVAMAMRTTDGEGKAAPPQPAATGDGTALVGATGVGDMPVGSASAADAAAASEPASQASPASIDIAALPDAVPVNTPAASPATAAPTATAAAATPAQPKPAAQPTSQGATASRASCGRTYTIAAGDAWVTIAKRHSVTTASLLAANGATRRTMLYPGRTICLPANASTPTTAKPVTTTTTKPVAAPPTTAKPVATVPAPPARSYSREEVIAIIREVWPDHLEDEAIRIATRESNLKPAARNYCCIGLFQIYFNVHKRWLATIGVTNANQLTDPRVNAYAAVTLWNRAGSWAPWRL